MTIAVRTITTADYEPIIQVIDQWWGGRTVAGLLPRLFFVHFQNSSFVAEEEGKIVGFLVGFRSQSYPEQAYIHFVGVDPDNRHGGLGRQLYEHFFEVVHAWGCTEVRCVTAPQNTLSIAFHTKMGFEIEPGDTEIDGVAATNNYDGRGGARVQFRKLLSTTQE